MNDAINALNGILFSNYTVYALLLTGLVFTIWSGFGQYRALTHGISVVRGKYDDKNDAGAINHFQALSAALSATVGLGNIAGVALAVALGGPGAVLWMWLIGVLGMAIKMTEVTQSMLYRNTDDPENPHGGPMFVVKKGFAEWGLAPLGQIIGGIFVVTLIISAVTGGNMFQAWNVADITRTYFGVPQIATGIVLTILVALVIIGGIKRIGAVAGRIVPFMCILYVLAALYVLVLNAGEIPSMLWLIVKSGLPSFLGGEDAAPVGAFLGGTFGYAALWGVKRALFSSEAGQGSSPIAHSAAKTDEPVREGVVAGLEPFIDTIVVCTLTALVIMSSGAYDRDGEASYATIAGVPTVQVVSAGEPGEWTLESPPLPEMNADDKKIRGVPPTADGWRDGETVFIVVSGDENADTGRSLRRINGSVNQLEDGTWIVDWGTLSSETTPTFRQDENGDPDLSVYGDYAGASLTAYAFDRVTPGLGKWLVSIAAWLFALSTMISWSYYGEQGIYFFFGKGKSSGTAVLIYKLVYAGLIFVTTLLAMPIFGAGGTTAIIGTDAELDMWTTLGLGVMLVANIPIMWIFGAKAMGAYHDYFKRMKEGGDDAHEAPPIVDVAEGKDVE
ncbi:MAG: amino acid carrier protein [Planctomycetota bacterium]